MSREAPGTRLALIGLAAAFVVAVAVFGTPGSAFGATVACEPQVALSVEATAAYDSAYGRYLDGIISNDSTVNVSCPVVEVRWLEDEGRVDKVWPRADGMLPGQWTAFHLCWPSGVPAEWTPLVSASGSQTDRSALRLLVDTPVAVGGESSVAMVVPEPEMRSWVATVTNDAVFPVSSIELIGAEWDGETFVDATFSWCEPAWLAPGESAAVEFHGKAPSDGDPVPDVFVEARERPTITLDASTLDPYYGSSVTFTLSLSDYLGAPISGWRTLKLFYSADGKNWCYVPKQTDTGVAVVKYTPDKPLYFKALYWGDDRYGMTESAPVKVTPQVIKTTPSAPSAVSEDDSFKVSGRMCAGAKSAGKPVYLRLYRYSRAYDKWVFKGSVKASADSAGRYSKSVSLPKTGSWKLRAYREGAGYSAYEGVKVR